MGWGYELVLGGGYAMSIVYISDSETTRPVSNSSSNNIIRRPELENTRSVVVTLNPRQKKFGAGDKYLLDRSGGGWTVVRKTLWIE